MIKRYSIHYRFLRKIVIHRDLSRAIFPTHPFLYAAWSLICQEILEFLYCIFRCTRQQYMLQWDPFRSISISDVYYITILFTREICIFFYTHSRNKFDGSCCKEFIVLSKIKLYIFNTALQFYLFSAYILYFCTLSTFSWLNVMCFDIWWTFGWVDCLSCESFRQRYFWGLFGLLDMDIWLFSKFQK